MNKITVNIASDMERDDPYAEVWIGDKQWGEVTFDVTLRLYRLEIFLAHFGAEPVFDLTELQRALEEAKLHLQRIGFIEP